VKVIINRTYAPIPAPRVRWYATLDEYQGGDPIGYGATPGAAVDDLMIEIDARLPDGGEEVNRN
jgi:hypothetical protein